MFEVRIVLVEEMPLVRYEVWCEHSLVDPELYRKALVRGAGGDDSSRALLEAVAVAGLVGIVRQLVDLAGYVYLSLSLSLSLSPQHCSVAIFLLCLCREQEAIAENYFSWWVCFSCGPYFGLHFPVSSSPILLKNS